MPIFNMTPHDVRIVDNDGNLLALLHSDGIARCECKVSQKNAIEGIPTIKLDYGEVIGLPEGVKGVYFIVSTLVKDSLPNRHDLLVPCGMLLQLPDGRRVKADKCVDKTGAIVVGCTALGR